MRTKELQWLIEKRIKADEKMVKNNKSATSRCYYEGKINAFKIVLKLLKENAHDPTRQNH